jgi:hypothetical protein
MSKNCLDSERLLRGLGGNGKGDERESNDG